MDFGAVEFGAKVREKRVGRGGGLAVLFAVKRRVDGVGCRLGKRVPPHHDGAIVFAPLVSFVVPRDWRFQGHRAELTTEKRAGGLVQFTPPAGRLGGVARAGKVEGKNKTAAGEGRCLRSGEMD
ncbi:hypothetical protein LBMAG56_25590 [Verrucomicrobiota bacterium]|nr:hypothetical protein LBMAG56_25590 [Verrucomicrobiota bacterium]